MIKPKKWTPGRTTDTYQKGQRGHVIAFPNADASVLERVLTPISSIPDNLQVVFISPSSNDSDLAEDVKRRKVKALHVRGKEVAAWARHLSKVRLLDLEWYSFGAQNNLRF